LRGYSQTKKGFGNKVARSRGKAVYLLGDNQKRLRIALQKGRSCLGLDIKNEKAESDCRNQSLEQGKIAVNTRGRKKTAKKKKSAGGRTAHVVATPESFSRFHKKSEKEGKGTFILKLRMKGGGCSDKRGCLAGICSTGSFPEREPGEKREATQRGRRKKIEWIQLAEKLLLN